MVIHITVVWSKNGEAEAHIQIIMRYDRWVDNWKHELVNCSNQFMWFILNETELT